MPGIEMGEFWNGCHREYFYMLIPTTQKLQDTAAYLSRLTDNQGVSNVGGYSVRRSERSRIRYPRMCTNYKSPTRLYFPSLLGDFYGSVTVTKVNR